MSEHTVEIRCIVNEKQPENSVTVRILLIDPVTATQTEELGTLTMHKHQWLGLKNILIAGIEHYLDGEFEVMVSTTVTTVTTGVETYG